MKRKLVNGGVLDVSFGYFAFLFPAMTSKLVICTPIKSPCRCAQHVRRLFRDLSLRERPCDELMDACDREDAWLGRPNGSHANLRGQGPRAEVARHDGCCDCR
jgi:hypothetical protein